MMDCARFAEVASEFALGLLDGQERADALAHLDRCPQCRTLADELAQAADALTLVAPPAEPPAGFETAVLARLDGVMGGIRQRRWWQRPVVGLAAALLVVAAVAGAVVVASNDGGGGDRVTAESHRWAVGTMTKPDGTEVGVVVVDDRPAGIVEMRVNGWDRPDVDYFVKLDYADGESMQLLLERSESGGFEVALPNRDVRLTDVSMVKADGTVLCHGSVEY